MAGMSTTQSARPPERQGRRRQQGDQLPRARLRAALQGEGLSPTELAMMGQGSSIGVAGVAGRVPGNAAGSKAGGASAQGGGSPMAGAGLAGEALARVSRWDGAMWAKVAGVAILIGAASLLQRCVPADIIVPRDLAASIDVVTTLVNAPLIDINHASLREVVSALHKALFAGLVIGGGYTLFSNISRRAAKRAEAAELRRQIGKAVDRGQLAINMPPGYTAVIMAASARGGNSWATDLGQNIGYQLGWGSRSLPLVQDADADNPTSSAYWIDLPGFGAEKTDGEYSQALGRAKLERSRAVIIVAKGGSRPFLPKTEVEGRFAHHFTEIQDHIDAVDKYLEGDGQTLRPIIIIDDADAYLCVQGQRSAAPVQKTLYEKVTERNRTRPPTARITIVDPSEEVLRYINTVYRPTVVDFLTLKDDAAEHGGRLRHKIAQVNSRADAKPPAQPPPVGFKLADRKTTADKVDLTIGATGVDPAALDIPATNRELVTVNTVTIILPDGSHALVAIDELVAARVQVVLDKTAKTAA